MSQDPNYLVNEIIFDDKVGILFMLEHRSQKVIFLTLPNAVIIKKEASKI